MVYVNLEFSGVIRVFYVNVWLISYNKETFSPKSATHVVFCSDIVERIANKLKMGVHSSLKH